MTSKQYQVGNNLVQVLFDTLFEDFIATLDLQSFIIVTDETVMQYHGHRFKQYRCISLPPGEACKKQSTVDNIIDQLLQFEADKQTMLVAVGGGVVTDVAGYAASIYKRGMPLTLVPTSVLGMVDAAVGGKNGVDVGLYKNSAGTIYQPKTIIYDYSFLDSLPVKEWINGFAEIIKHACIRDAVMFGMLERYGLHELQADKSLMASLVERNVGIKMDIVVADEMENHDRKLLNFGHTFGHAVENLHEIPHGHAISIGMVAACGLSEMINDFHFADAQRVVKLLARYHLPVDIETDHARVFLLLKQDKKREADQIQFVLLNRIGDAVAKPVALSFLEEKIKSLI